jgi:sulfur-oxidizing protein SoxA
MKRRASFATLTALAVLLGCTAPPLRPDTRRSGFDFMGEQTQAMQRDDSANPGMLWVQDGQVAWNTAPRADAKACVGCHAAAESSMKGVAARYPAWDAASARPVNLGTRINLCRERYQQLPPLAADHQQLLSLEAYVAHQSRGLPIAPDPDPRLTLFRERGAQLFAQRLGQLNLSCAQCHDQLAGHKLAGSVIPQAHPTGYPLYRLEWQGVGSLQRRLRACLAGMRAEPYPYGAPELVDLELYLKWRARGLAIETPAVRP